MKRNNNFYKLKTALVAVLVSCLALVTHAQVALPHYDGFNYTIGTSLTTNNWTPSSTGDSIYVASGDLSYIGLPAPTGNKVIFDGAGVDYNKRLPKQTVNKIYYSFILKITSISSIAADGFFIGYWQTSSTFGATLWTRRVANQYRLGISFRNTVGSVTWSDELFNINDSLFIVGCYEFVSGIKNDTAKLWINPSYTTFGATIEPIPTLDTANNSSGGNNDLDSIVNLYLRQNTTNSTPFIEIDELRLGNSWADVTPRGIIRPDNPAAFTATAVSGTQINLNWELNGANDSVIVVYNTDSIFSQPSDSTNYSVGSTIGTGNYVIYKGLATSFSHTGLTSQTQYFYKAWSFDSDYIYSASVAANATTWDTTPPLFITGYPAINNIGSTHFDLNIQLNKQGKAYIYVQNDTMPAPSINTIITNGDSLDITNNNTTFTKTISELDPETAYNVYVIARNLKYYYQSNYTLLDVITLSADTTAPVFNLPYPMITGISYNTATLAVSMDEPGIAYYLLLNDSAPAPTRVQVMAGTSMSIDSANTVYTANISGLTLNTAYDLYIIAHDNNAIPNLQDTTVLIEFTNIDTTAPQYIASYPAITNIEATMFDLEVQLNETGKLYFKIMADGSPAPTINEIMASDSVAVTAATTTFTHTITGLTPLTAYDVYVIAKDDNGNVQSAAIMLEATTLDMDITPPSFTATYPKVENIIYNAAIFKAAIDEPGMIYFKLQADGTPPPTMNQVIANDSIQAPTANVEVMRLLSGLTEQTAYDLYVIARDNADIPNFQSTLTLVEFATPAKPTGELFFSEYIEGSSNNKALEIYNPASSTIDLASYSLRIGVNGGAWTATLNLAGNLNPNHVFVVAHGSASAQIMAVTNVTNNSIANFTGNDAIGLFKNGVLIDVIGQYLNNPGTAWSVAGVANATAEHTLVRKSYVIAGDTNWTNSAGTDSLNSQWLVYPQNTFSYLGWHNEVPTIPIISGVAIQPATPVDLDSVRVIATVTDDSAVATVLCRWGLSASNLNSNLPMTLITGANYQTVNKIPPQTTGTIVYFRVVAWDNSGNSDSSNVMSYTVIDTATLTSIYHIQFTTDPSGNSPLLGQQVKTQGVVTAVRTGTTKAYFIQDGAGEWKGIYVYDNTNTPAVGDSVIIRGTVSEYNGLTQISAITFCQTVSTGNPLPAAEEISIGDMGESHESVLISFDSVNCINTNAGFNMWTIKDALTNDSLRVDDDLYLYAPTLNRFYDVKGIGFYSHNDFKILPRNASDIVECVGIKEFDIMDYSIYPNPATQSITISLPNGQNYGISIIDALGNVVYKTENAVSGQINLQYLSKGIYTFMVTDTRTQQTASKKLIVQ